MPYITETRKDGSLLTALENFRDVCTGHAAELGLSPAELLELADMVDGFRTDLEGWVEAAVAAKAALVAKDQRKADARAMVSELARRFRADLSVDDTLLTNLMLPRHKTPATKTAPQTPTDLVYDADIQGRVRLKWNRNGNIERTVFLVEAFRNGDWAQVQATTRTKTVLPTTPGEPVQFRVRAMRGDAVSQPSLPVSLWSGGLRAAA